MLLANVTNAKFTFGGRATSLPTQLRLEVDGVGDLNLPVLDNAHAAPLIAVVRDVQIGRDSDSDVDKTWEIDAAKVHLTNPEWARGLDALSTETSAKLGFVSTPVTMHAYKLLLYGPGGHFVRHRDTEKHDRMFATVVVQLPSRYEGGELIVYQDPHEPGAEAQAIAHDFGGAEGMRAFAAYYAVHYADAEHELTPVTSGYRLMLVYSLCWPETLPMPQFDRLAHDRLAQQLAVLAKAGEHFCYFLDHHYTEKSTSHLGTDMLKGVDKARFQLLQAASMSLPSEDQFVWLLAQVHRKTKLQFRPEEWERDQRPQYSVGPWFTIDGEQLDEDCDYDDGFEITDMSKVLNPDGKSRTGLWAGPRVSKETYTGNEGMSRITQSHRYVLVGVPRAQISKFAAQHLGPHRQRAMLVQGVTDDPNWLTTALTSIRSYEAAGDLLLHALSINQPITAAPILAAYPEMLLFDGSRILPKLCTPEVWPSARDAVQTAIATRPSIRHRFNVSVPAICALSTHHVPRAEWETLLQAALALLPEVPLNSTAADLVKVLLDIHDLALVRRVLDDSRLPSFLAEGGRWGRYDNEPIFNGTAGSTKIVTACVESVHWPELQETVMARIAAVPREDQFGVCFSALAEAPIRPTVDLARWAPVLDAAFAALPAARVEVVKRHAEPAWRHAVNHVGTDWIEQIVALHRRVRAVDMEADMLLSKAETVVAPISEKALALVPIAQRNYAALAAPRVPPAYGWAYPDAKCADFEVQWFLRKDVRSLTIDPYGSGIAEARARAEKIKKEAAKYKITATASGKGKRARVTIEKTLQPKDVAAIDQPTLQAEMERMVAFYGPSVTEPPELEPVPAPEPARTYSAPQQQPAASTLAAGPTGTPNAEMTTDLTRAMALSSTASASPPRAVPNAPVASAPNQFISPDSTRELFFGVEVRPYAEMAMSSEALAQSPPTSPTTAAAELASLAEALTAMAAAAPTASPQRAPNVARTIAPHLQAATAAAAAAVFAHTAPAQAEGSVSPQQVSTAMSVSPRVVAQAPTAMSVSSHWHAQMPSALSMTPPATTTALPRQQSATSPPAPTGYYYAAPATAAGAPTASYAQYQQQQPYYQVPPLHPSHPDCAAYYMAVSGAAGGSRHSAYCNASFAAPQRMYAPPTGMQGYAGQSATTQPSHAQSYASHSAAPVPQQQQYPPPSADMHLQSYAGQSISHHHAPPPAYGHTQSYASHSGPQQDASAAADQQSWEVARSPTYLGQSATGQHLYAVQTTAGTQTYALQTTAAGQQVFVPAGYAPMPSQEYAQPTATSQPSYAPHPRSAGSQSYPYPTTSRQQLYPEPTAGNHQSYAPHPSASGPPGAAAYETQYWATAAASPPANALAAAFGTGPTATSPNAIQAQRAASAKGTAPPLPDGSNPPTSNDRRHQLFPPGL